MVSDDALSLHVFGLERDNGLVRADIFARQVSLVVRGLKAADKHANGHKTHDFLVRDLQQSSALAVFGEKARTRRPVESSTALLGEVFDRVYRGDTRAERYPRSLLTPVSVIAIGSPKKFDHTEIGYCGDKVVRLDDFFLRQVTAILTTKREAVQAEREMLFKGISRTTFDGELVVLDRRGESLRGKLTLTAGRKELDCTIRRELLQDVLNNFETRLRVSGLAIYDGTGYLPQRFDVEHIDPVPNARSSLNYWSGKFRIPDNESAYPVDRER